MITLVPVSPSSTLRGAHTPGRVLLSFGLMIAVAALAVAPGASAADKPAVVIKMTDIPPGAKPFDSGFMRPGTTFDYTFTVPGTYRYTCVPHEKDGMNGTVVVTK